MGPDICFMCLQEIDDCEEEEEEVEEDGHCSRMRRRSSSSLLPFKLLAKYLKLDMEEVWRRQQQLSSSSVPLLVETSLPMKDFEAGALLCLLCRQCSEVGEQFSELYQQLELVRLKVEACVAKMQGVMEGAARREEDDQLVSTTFRERVAASKGGGGPEEWEAAAVVDIIRKELLEKCSKRLTNAVPRVKIKRLLNENQNNIVNLSRSSPQPSVHYHPQEHVDIEDFVFGDQSMETCQRGPWSPQTQEVHSATKVPPPPPPLLYPSMEEDELLQTRESYTPPAVLPTPATLHANKGVVKSSAKYCNLHETFTKLLNGLFRCHICGMEVSKKETTFHRLSHTKKKASAKHRKKCEHCGHVFVAQMLLDRHIMTRHKFSYFTQFKDPRLSQERFSKLVGVLLEKGNAPVVECPNPNSTLSNNWHKCGMCFFSKFMKTDVLIHMVRHHMDHLSAQLMALQQEELAKVVWVPPPAPPPSIPFLLPPLLPPPRSQKVSKNRRPQVHLNNRLPTLQCEHCTAVFHIPQSRNRHRITFHMETYFLSLWSSDRLGINQFKALVLELFKKVNILETDRSSRTLYKCKFCNEYRNVNLSDTRLHLVQYHMEQLEFELTLLLGGGGEITYQGESDAQPTKPSENKPHPGTSSNATKIGGIIADEPCHMKIYTDDDDTEIFKSGSQDGELACPPPLPLGRPPEHQQQGEWLVSEINPLDLIHDPGDDQHDDISAETKCKVELEVDEQSDSETDLILGL